MRRWKWWAVMVVDVLMLGFTTSIRAASEFTTRTETVYQISETGKAHVTSRVWLTNKMSTIYASSYQFSFLGTAPENLVAKDRLGVLKSEITKEGETTKISLQFNDKVVGKENVLAFSLNYDLPGSAVLNGQVWEINLPKLGGEQIEGDQSIVLKVPVNFGKPAAIFPKPISQSTANGWQQFSFNPRDLTDNGVLASFGNFQLFDFILSYHLKNPGEQETVVEIALPPDMNRQRVTYKQIIPSPAAMKVDGDGNWMASFRVKRKETLTVKAEGVVQIFSAGLDQYFWQEPGNWETYISPKNYWPSNDEEMQKLARKLVTPEKIYRFVVANLNYDAKRIRKDVQRLGGKKALENPDQAICSEFTDLFITLSRAAGIPAREVEGYAYTTNPEIQPLSLESDVLHAWPEYWDNKKREWIPVDPTWEKTTGGVDYFNSFDLNHFGFVIHGQDSENPLPAGSYKLSNQASKDVVVNFGGELPQVQQPVDVLLSVKPASLTAKQFLVDVEVINRSGQAKYKLPVNLTVAGARLDEFNLQRIAVLPPFGSFSEEGKASESWLMFVPPKEVRAEIAVDNQIKAVVLQREKFIGRWLLPYLLGATILIVPGVLVLIKTKRVKSSETIV